jgi:hypothetical protein
MGWVAAGQAGLRPGFSGLGCGRAGRVAAGLSGPGCGRAGWVTAGHLRRAGTRRGHRDRAVRLHRSFGRAAGQPGARGGGPAAARPGGPGFRRAGHRAACRVPAGRSPAGGPASLGVADVLPEPIIAAPGSPGPWRDYWILTDYRSGPAPVVAEAATLEAEMHLVSRGVGLSITSESVGVWYRRPGVTFVPILDLAPCSVSLAWWP